MKPETRISIIAAMGENRVIGVGNRLPWHLPEDLKRFRRLTTGHAVIMGRKNFESIGKPLPNRHNIVVTRNPDFSPPGCTVVGSLKQALAAAADDPEIFIIGGGEIYAQMVDQADRLYLTVVHARPAGDAYFPPFDAAAWREVGRERHEADGRHTYPYTFITLDREESRR